MRQRWKVLAVTSAAVFMGFLDNTNSCANTVPRAPVRR